MASARRRGAWLRGGEYAGPGGSGAVIDARQDLEARAGMLRETLDVSNYSTVTHMVVAVVLAYICWGHVPTAYLVAFDAAMALLVATTMGWTHRSRRGLGVALSDAVVRRGFRLAPGVGFLYGLLWSMVSILLIPSRDGEYQLMAGMIAVGVISDAYVVGPIPAVSMSLIAPVLLGTLIGLSQFPYPSNVYLDALIVIYALFVLFSTRGMSRLSYQRLLDRAVVREQSQTIGLLLKEFEESASDWLWELDVEGRLRSAPPRMAAAIGERAERLVGVSLPSLLSRHACRGDEADGVAELLAAIDGRQSFHDHVIRIATSQGTRWWCLSGKPCRDSSGAFAGYQGVGSDITQGREAEARIGYLASHDTLTGLPNRGAFHEAIGRACRDGSPEEARRALLCVDLDGFKAVNDAHGHLAGDLLLRTAADRLAALCGPGSRAYRLGGDEFAVLHRCDDPASAERLAARVVEHVGRPYAVDGLPVSVGASVGIAYASAEIRDAETLLGRADLALYGAKAAGKGRWQSFDPQLEQRALRRRRLDAAMRAALPADGLQLHYQPQVDAGSETIVGVEALLRWHLPGEGWISPAEIIPIAEATGFVADIGRWALVRACTDVLAWPGLTVAVNISSAHFRSPDFCDQVEAVLDRTGLEPGRLEIEITESIFLDGGGEATANMVRLRDRGVRLSLDDFGTGYSSLSYLNKFAFDKLKIDRSFVRDLHARRDTLAIFDAINAMAAALRISVTVEGVEHEEQIAVLRPRFSGTIQGFYYGRPQPADRIAGEVLAFEARSRAKRDVSRPEAAGRGRRTQPVERRAS